MPAANLSPGFFGKIPATGDFVSRRLPADFVSRWDRWLAQYLAPLIDTPGWDAAVPLRFLSGPGAFGNAAGVVFASRDRVGRRFPLSFVALLASTDSAMARYAGSWFREMEKIGLDARDACQAPGELDAVLSGIAFPVGEAASEAIDGMVVWTEMSDLYDIDPDDSVQVLESLLAVGREPG